MGFFAKGEIAQFSLSKGQEISEYFFCLQLLKKNQRIKIPKASRNWGNRKAAFLKKLKKSEKNLLRFPDL